MLPARTTELARTADLHILYRRAALKHEGAITPEIHDRLMAEAEKQVPPLKEKTMIDIEQARSNSEHSEPPAPLKRGDRVRIVNDPDGDWTGKVGVIRQLRGNGKGGLAQAGVDIAGKYPDSRSERRYFRFEDLIAVPADDAKIDALVEAHEPTPAPKAKMPLLQSANLLDPWGVNEMKRVYEAQQQPAPKGPTVVIERPGGEHTIGIAVVSAANVAPDGMVPVQVAPGVIETVERIEIKTLEDVLMENTRLHREIAKLKAQLAALHASQQMTPLARTGVWEIRTLTQETLMTEQRIEADKILNNLLKDEWQIVPQLCFASHSTRIVFLQRQTRAVEPKPEADKPGNVRDFPIPDAELTTEDDGVSAHISGLPVSASRGLGRGVGVRRA